MHPAISPDGTRSPSARSAICGWCRRARADATPRAAHQRRVRRDQPGVVARRQRDRALDRPRRRGRRSGCTTWRTGRRSPGGAATHDGGVVARRLADRLPRRRVAAAHRATSPPRAVPGARPAVRAGAPELVARRPRGGDVGAAAVLDALPRGHQPGAAGRRRARHDRRTATPPTRPTAGSIPMPHKSVGMRENFGPVWSPNGREMAAIVDGQLTTYPVARDGTPDRPAAAHLDRAAPARRRGPPTRGASSIRWPIGFRLVDLVDGSVAQTSRRRGRGRAKTTTGTTTVHAGRFFDGRAGAPRGPTSTSSSTATASPRSRRIATRCTAAPSSTPRTAPSLPGLIESHTHLSKAFGEAQGRIWLSFGITTVRNPATNGFEGAGGARGDRVGRAGRPARVHHRRAARRHRGLLPGRRRARRRRQGRRAAGTRAGTLRFDFIKTYVRLPDLLQKRVIEGAHGAACR